MTNPTGSLTACIADYCHAVADGRLPRAYRGILASLTLFQTTWKSAHPADTVGALYQGYMDMSFVAFAPAALAEKRLKISLVFLHDEGVFTLWLTAGNRAIQAETSAALRGKPLGGYTLCALKPGVDAVIAHAVPLPYAFDEPERLIMRLMKETEHFLDDMIALIEAL